MIGVKCIWTKGSGKVRAGNSGSVIRSARKILGKIMSHEKPAVVSH